MEREAGPPRFHENALTGDQIAMMEFLGNPRIIGSAGTGAYVVDPGEDRDGVTSIAPRHIISYTVPVIDLLGRARRVMPNGDLAEVSRDKIEPPLPRWSK